jgi:intraflagellar transport protein 122
VNCDEPFVFSFVSFEALPLVRIRLQRQISDSEATDLLLQSPSPIDSRIDRSAIASGSKEEPPSLQDSRSVNVLRLEGDSQPNMAEVQQSNDALDEALNMFGSAEYDRDMLLRVPPPEVIILRWPSPLKYEFWRNLMPEIRVVNCDNCNKLYLAEELETHLIQHRSCPFCRKAMTVLDRK